MRAALCNAALSKQRSIMTTIRNSIESFVYPILEYYTDLVYKGGEDTVIRGIRVLDDSSKFTHGTLVNGAAALYAYYVREGDPRAEEVLKRFHAFLYLAAKSECKTWGKLAILRAFNTLRENGLLDRIDPEAVELVKTRTEYTDFFDKESCTLRGYATNYYQVAMACAGYRELLGWETGEPFAEKIKDKLAKIMKEESAYGWMDDEMPHGRYDRYTIVLASEFVDTALDVQLEVPENVIENLKKAMELCLFIANDNGDGILYGRSIPFHGDGTIAEVLSSAFAKDLVEKKDEEHALIAILRLVEKTKNVWFDKEANSVNIWWGGRTTNYYRGIHRLLEVNLDMTNHLLTTLKNLERCGLADKDISGTIPSPEKWEMLEIDFAKDPIKKTLFMKRGDMLLTLPFVGMGRLWGRRAPYYPLPVAHRRLEASPISEDPFFVPEYKTEDGNVYRPGEFFENVNVTKLEEGARISVDGWLNLVNTNVPAQSEYKFHIEYEINALSVKVDFSADIPATLMRMVTGVSSEDTKVDVYGFESSIDVDTDGKIEYCGVEGPILNVKHHTRSSLGNIGYTILFS